MNTQTSQEKFSLFLEMAHDLLPDLSPEDIMKVFDVFTNGLLHQANALLPYKKQQARMRQTLAFDLSCITPYLSLVKEFDGPVDAPTVIVGHHGTTWSAAEKILERSKKGTSRPFSISRNEWDWLGYGVYFWMMAPHLAAIWAKIAYKIQRAQKPWLPNLADPTKEDFVIPPNGRKSHFAVIEVRLRIFPEHTLNLLDVSWEEFVKESYHQFEEQHPHRSLEDRARAESNYEVVFEKEPHKGGDELYILRKYARPKSDGRMRTKDCMFFNSMIDEYKKIQCIIAAFREGDQIVPGVNIWSQDHVQINVIDQSIIDVERTVAYDAEDFEQLPGL
jgi:hypothetical protein